MVDIFSGEIIDEVTIYNKPWSIHASIVHIKEEFSVVNAYVDNKVPKILLQRLYYKINGIDNKILKLGTMQ